MSSLLLVSSSLVLSSSLSLSSLSSLSSSSLSSSSSSSSSPSPSPSPSLQITSSDMEPYFPHLTSTGVAPSCIQIIEKYNQEYLKQISTGSRHPFVFPHHFLSAFLLFIYLCIPHKKYSEIYAARWPLIAFITWFQWHLIWETTGVGLGLGYPISFLSALVIIWSWTWLIFMKPQWDAKRVQRVRVRTLTTKEIYLVEPDKLPVDNKGLQYEESFEYFWQSYPDDLKDRIPWVFDLLFNMRGPGWNWAISCIPSLPPAILRKLGDTVPEYSHSNITYTGCKRFNTRHELLLHQLPRFIISYLILDILRIIMMNDPYFKFGPTTYAIPFYLEWILSFFPSFASPILLQSYRLIVVEIVIQSLFTLILATISIFFSYICGPSIFGLRAEPWYYPSIWGNIFAILRDGLGGWWGGFWHQSFRIFFTGPYSFLVRKGIIKKSNSALSKDSSLLAAFFVSGFIHWAGSVSSISTGTYPRHCLIFFPLQAMGIIIQRRVCEKFSPQIKKYPIYIRYCANSIYTLLFLLFTGWLCADDFGRGGLWLREPIPFSPLQGLGFGEEGSNTWWRWQFLSLKWYTGEKWWQSGFVLL